mgnify:CR=1 FL=1
MKNKLKILSAVLGVIIAVAVLVESILAYVYLPNTLSVVMIITGALAFLLSLVAAIALDYSAGDYECRKCGHRFMPTICAYIWGIHTITTRRLKCPKCGEKSFCKRKLI